MIMFSGQTGFLVEKCRIGLDFHRQDLTEKKKKEGLKTSSYFKFMKYYEDELCLDWVESDQVTLRLLRK